MMLMLSMLHIIAMILCSHDSSTTSALSRLDRCQAREGNVVSVNSKVNPNTFSHRAREEHLPRHLITFAIDNSLLVRVFGCNSGLRSWTSLLPVTP